MGNRAVIAFGSSKHSPCIYVHWNGGRASIEGFLSAARDLGLRHIHSAPDFFRALHSIIGSFLGGSVYLEQYGRADTDNWDNGVYFIDRDLNITRRAFRRDDEEINPEKTEAIRARIVSRAPIFNA